ncbi:MAG: GNAT family N-acetyltransferase [Rufibacter sp.]
MPTHPLIQIKNISPESTWELRHRVLWPHKPLAYVQLPEDAEGLHYGLFLDSTLVSVASIFRNGNQAQLRKFATDTQHQGQGYGSQLLGYILAQLPALHIDSLWCNARQSKTGFYQKFGFRETDTVFEKDGEHYVAMEWGKNGQ